MNFDTCRFDCVQIGREIGVVLIDENKIIKQVKLYPGDNNMLVGVQEAIDAVNSIVEDIALAQQDKKIDDFVASQAEMDQWRKDCAEYVNRQKREQ